MISAATDLVKSSFSGEISGGVGWLSEFRRRGWSGFKMMTFWSGMKSSAESRREKPSEGSSAAISSSAKNSKVLVLKAVANLENISEMGGALGVVVVVVAAASTISMPKIGGILMGD